MKKYGIKNMKELKKEESRKKKDIKRLEKIQEKALRE